MKIDMKSLTTSESSSLIPINDTSFSEYDSYDSSPPSFPFSVFPYSAAISYWNSSLFIILSIPSNDSEFNPNGLSLPSDDSELSLSPPKSLFKSPTVFLTPCTASMPPLTV